MLERMDRQELAAFLRSRRARVRPEDVGLKAGTRRRTPGLRREEVAQLAGMSVDYYIRLEQGRGPRPSRQILAALARALRLTDDERGHLYHLAGEAPELPAGPSRDVPPGILHLLERLDDTPAYVLNARHDILAWNPLGRALLCGHLNADAPARVATRPNMAAQVFLDADTRELYTDWRAKCRAVVGNLRLVVGQHPDDPVLASLIGTLSIASPEFASLWADHRVQACATAGYTLHHPLVGDLAVTQQTLRSIDHPDQTLVTHTAPAGSSSAEALTLLAQIVGDQPARRAVSPSGHTMRSAGGHD